MQGATVRVKVEGITSLAPLAILSGRLNGDPLKLFGKTIVPYEESRIPPDAEGGTYIFLARQWEASDLKKNVPG
jgi:hypothetical protein